MTTDGENRGSTEHCAPVPKDIRMPPSPISPVSPLSDPGRLVISSPTGVFRCSSPRSTSSPDLPDRASSPESDPGLRSDGDQVAPSLAADTTARRGYAPDQVATMKVFYRHTPDPTHDQYQQLAAALRLNTRRIKFWFKNQRATDRNPSSLQTSPETASSRDVSLSDETDANDSTNSQDRAHHVPDVLTHKMPKLEEAPRPSTGQALTSTEYAAMTIVSLPPDHPFCQLLPNLPNNRRTRRPPRSRPVDEYNTISTTPVARPPHARRQTKRGEKAVQALSVKQEAPPVPALWRPIDAGNTPTMPLVSLPPPPPQIPQGAPSGSPLDLSVSLKRKRAGSPDAPTSGERTKKSHLEARLPQPPAHQLPLTAAHPMMFPPSFPYYTANPYMHLSLPTYPPGALQSMPLGLYPPPLNVWGMPAFGHPQKTVR